MSTNNAKYPDFLTLRRHILINRLPFQALLGAWLGIVAQLHCNAFLDHWVQDRFENAASRISSVRLCLGSGPNMVARHLNSSWNKWKKISILFLIFWINSRNRQCSSVFLFFCAISQHFKGNFHGNCYFLKWDKNIFLANPENLDWNYSSNVIVQSNMIFKINEIIVLKVIQN